MAKKLLEGLDDSILDMLDAGIHIIDSDGNTIYYNTIMGYLENLDPKYVIGKNLLEIFPSLTRNTSTLLYVAKTGKTITDCVQTYLNYKGRKITTINTTYPLKKGKIVGALELANDITKLSEFSENAVSLENWVANQKIHKKTLHLCNRFNFAYILGQSRAIKQTISMAKKAAKTSSNVLLYGETGTGKELFAQSIHNASYRRKRPFIAQNCAALPETLLESILFGTVKGSYTGAVDSPGLFEQANGGTLLLDEINSMGKNLQAKLLRVLQENAIRRVGGTKEIFVDVRVISTANKDPIESVSKGIIRKDLFYRLGVVCIKIPPLRDRREDIPILTKHFIDKMNYQLCKDIIGISSDVKKFFMGYEWPGNVRELSNAIESSMNMITNEDFIEVRHLPFYMSEHYSPSIKSTHKTQNKEAIQTVLWNTSIRPTNKSDEPIDISLQEMLGDFEKSIILSALKAYNGNISQAAKKLKIKRQTLQYKIKKYDISC